MKKKVLFWRLVASLVWLFPLTFAYAENVTIDGLIYYLYHETHEAAINNGNTWSGELDIPSEVNYNGETYTVIGMTNLAFDGCELTKVRIPKTIEHIIQHVLTDDPNIFGQSAPESVCMNPFQRCKSLEAIEVDEDNPSTPKKGIYIQNGHKRVE